MTDEELAFREACEIDYANFAPIETRVSMKAAKSFALKMSESYEATAIAELRWLAVCTTMLKTQVSVLI